MYVYLHNIVRFVLPQGAPGRGPRAPLPGGHMCMCMYVYMCIYIYICMYIYIYIYIERETYIHTHTGPLRDPLVRGRQQRGRLPRRLRPEQDPGLIYR